MPHVLGQRPRESVRFTLNSDGQRHPRENTFTILTFVCGVVAFPCGLLAVVGVPAIHVVASAVGLLGTAIGLYAQLISATTAQRWLTVIGIGGAFVGCALGIATGGLLP